MVKKATKTTIHEVSRVIGLLVSSLPGVVLSPLNYRAIEYDEVEALNRAKGKIDCHMTLPYPAVAELQWWVASLPAAYNDISHGTPVVSIKTDASLIG